MSATALPPPLDRFVTAVNRGDADSAFALFATDGEVDDWGRRFATPRDIRCWSDREFVGADGHLRVVRVARSGDQVTVDAQWTSRHYSGNGRFIFTLDDGRIRRMRIVGE